jgi:hypothetical protein
MKAGRLLASFLLLVSAVGTLAADAGFMHAGNGAWPPHARFHALWNAAHVLGTHGLALALLWSGAPSTRLLRTRIALGIFLCYMAGFFAVLLVSPRFGAAVTPDLPADLMPPRPFGLDGNLFLFLATVPLFLLAWRLCRKDPSPPAG